MNKKIDDTKSKIVIFKGRKIRKIIYKNEWWFSVIDVVNVLTGSSTPKRYWSDLKKKLKEENFQVYEKIVQLKLVASDGKKYSTDCANTECMLRIIQSIPSPKAEPFKRWLSKVGYERIQEIEDPQLAMDRMRKIYEEKGYSKSWIEKRVRGIAVRQDLTKEWDERGAKEGKDFAILTNEIMRGTFDKGVSEYKKHKGLKKENLRDHMDDLELILTMLGEATTTRITKDRNSKGMPKLKKDAKDGGKVAGKTRRNIEKLTGKKVASKKNFLGQVKQIDEK